jgi:hypothetical protein
MPKLLAASEWAVLTTLHDIEAALGVRTAGVAERAAEEQAKSGDVFEIS